MENADWFGSFGADFFFAAGFFFGAVFLADFFGMSPSWIHGLNLTSGFSLVAKLYHYQISDTSDFSGSTQVLLINTYPAAYPTQTEYAITGATAKRYVRWVSGGYGNATEIEFWGT